jgi:hypothetical protein
LVVNGNSAGVINTALDGVAVYNNSVGNVVLTAGTVTSNLGDGTAIYNYGTGRIIVSGATVRAAGGASIRQYVNGTTLVSSGMVSATSGIAIYNYADGDVIVSGGTISSTTGAAIYNFADGNINVSGGTISVTLSGMGILNRANGNITLTDGIITSASGHAIQFVSTTATTVLLALGNVTISGTVYFATRTAATRTLLSDFVYSASRITTFNINGAVAGDVLFTGQSTFLTSFKTANVGLTLGVIGTDIVFEAGGLAFTVTALNDKVYDGTDTALSGAYSIMFSDGLAHIGDYTVLSAMYSSKDAGERNITVTITTSLDIAIKTVTSANMAAIAKRSITPIVTGVAKTYDGTTNAIYSIHYTISWTNVVSGETLAITTDFTVGSAIYNLADVGSRTITASTIALTSSTKALNYTLLATSATSVAFTISKKAVTFTVAAAMGKTYDGSTSGAANAGTLTFSGNLTTFTITTHYTVAYTYSSKDVGLRTVTAIVTLVGTAATNYNLANTPTANSATSTNTVNITALGISYTVTAAAGKTYDGTDTVVGNAYIITFSDGLAHTGEYTIVSAKYSSANAGARTITATVSVSGSADWSVTSNSVTSSNTVYITPADLSYTISATAGKVYDGNADAGASKYSITWIGNYETIEYGVTSAKYASKNVGDRTITAVLALTGASLANYTLITTSATSDDTQAITKATIIPIVTFATHKVYDGTISATYGTNYALEFTGLVNGEILVRDTDFNIVSAVYDTKNVGSGRRIAVVAALLNTTCANNYILATNTAISGDVEITKKVITATVNALDKTYDGTTAAIYGTNYTLTFDGLVIGDSLTYNTDFRVGSAEYSALVGTASIGVSGIELLPSWISINYLLENTDAESEPVTIVIVNETAFTVIALDGKVYDGTTAAVASSYAIVFADGLLHTGEYTVTQAVYSSKDAGAAKLTVTVVLNPGVAFGLTNSTATSANSVTITKKGLAFLVNGKDKTFDKTTTAEYEKHYTLTFLGLIDGETLSYGTDFGVGNAAYNSEKVGTTKISVTGVVLNETAVAANYALVYTEAESGEVSIVAAPSAIPLVAGIAGGTVGAAGIATIIVKLLKRKRLKAGKVVKSVGQSAARPNVSSSVAQPSRAASAIQQTPQGVQPPQPSELPTSKRPPKAQKSAPTPKPSEPPKVKDVSVVMPENPPRSTESIIERLIKMGVEKSIR